MPSLADKYYDVVVALREQGLTFKQIASQLGMSEASAARIHKKGPPRPKLETRGRKSAESNTVVAESESSKIIDITKHSQHYLRLETKDYSLVQYLRVYGKYPTEEDGVWIYESPKEQLIPELPGLPVWFTTWKLD